MLGEDSVVIPVRHNGVTMTSTKSRRFKVSVLRSSLGCMCLEVQKFTSTVQLMKARLCTRCGLTRSDVHTMDLNS